MPSNWLLFDRMRAYMSGSGIYPHESIIQNQSALENLSSSGSERGGIQSAIIQSIQVNYFRRERYRDYDKMDEMGEISLALDIYADEASIINPETGSIVQVKGTKTHIKKRVEKLFNKTIMADHETRPLIRYLCKYGCAPYRIIVDKARKNVIGIKPLDVYNFTRIETSSGDLVAFHYADPETMESYFLHPWEVVHFRLKNNEKQFHPYGKSIVEGGRKAFKQLTLMENSAVIYRLTRAPQKRKFKIPVGNIPSHQVPEYMRKIAAMFKNKRFYNPQTGEFDERYSPLTQEDDFFLPFRPDGSGPDVETLQGADNLGQIEDIEYFLKKMVAPTKIPISRLGIGDVSADDSKPVSQISSEFAKNVGWVQQAVSVGFTKIALVHLALQNCPKEDLESFWVTLMVSSAMEELYRIETWQTRANIMADLNEIGWFPKEWIISKFTDLSPDEIEQMIMNSDASDESTPELGGGLGGGGGLDDIGAEPGGEMGGEMGGDMGDEPGAEPGAEGDMGSESDAEAGGDISDDTAADLDELMSESVDVDMLKLARLEKIVSENNQKMARSRKLHKLINNSRDNSLCEHIVLNGELRGLTTVEPKMCKIITENLDEAPNTEANFESYEGVDESKFQYGVPVSLDVAQAAYERSLVNEQRILDADRINQVIIEDTLDSSVKITERDLPR